MSTFNLTKTPTVSSVTKSNASFNLIADNPSTKKIWSDLRQGGLLIFAVSVPLKFNGMQTNIPTKLKFSFFGVFIAEDAVQNTEHGSMIAASVELDASNFDKLKLPKEGSCVKISKNWEMDTKPWGTCKYAFTVNTPVFHTAEAIGLDSLSPDILSKYHIVKANRFPTSISDTTDRKRNTVVECLEGTSCLLQEPHVYIYIHFSV
jgi:hypothetical protein